MLLEEDADFYSSVCRDQLDDLDDTEDSDAVVNNKYKCEMLLRVKGLDPEEENHENVKSQNLRIKYRFAIVSR